MKIRSIIPLTAEQLKSDLARVGSLVVLLLAIPLGAYLHFGIQHLGQFETADEYRWIYPDSRVPRYWDTMKRGDWKDTMINDKPGIATAIVSGWAMNYMGWNALTLRFAQQGEYSRIFNPDWSVLINYIARLPLLVLNGSLSVLWYFLLRRLTKNNWTALLSVSLVLLNPILIGISQIVNPDTLLWSASFTSILSFLAFLKFPKPRYAVLSGFFLGAALLSKYTAVILIPYYFVLLVAYLIFFYENLKKENIFRQRTIRICVAYFFIIAAGILIYAFFMPAVFNLSLKAIIKSNDAFKKIFPYLRYIGWIWAFILADALLFRSWIIQKIIWPIKYSREIGARLLNFFTAAAFVSALWNWSAGNYWNVSDMLFDAGNDKIFRGLEFSEKILLELRPFVFSLTPIVVFLLLFSWAIHVFKRKTENSFMIFALTLFFLFFYLAVIKADYLVTARYSIVLYPIAAVIAVLGITEFLPQRQKFAWPIGFAFFAAIIWFSVGEIFGIYPFYFNYANRLLPREKVISSAWGYGGYEAAQYIKTQTGGADNLIAWTDYDGFCPFFSGLCVKDSEVKWIGYETANKINYYIVTPRGKEKLKSTWEKMKPNVSERPQWRLEIGGRPGNFIEVYEVIKSDFKDNDWWRDRKKMPVER